MAVSGPSASAGSGPKCGPAGPATPARPVALSAGPQAAIRVTATARRLGELCAHGPSARAAASLGEYVAYPSGSFHGPIEQESNALSTNLRLAIGDEKGPSRWRVCLKQLKLSSKCRLAVRLLQPHGVTFGAVVNLAVANRWNELRHVPEPPRRRRAQHISTRDPGCACPLRCVLDLRCCKPTNAALLGTD